MSGLSTEIVRDWGGVERIGAEWDELLPRSRSDILFLRREWVAAWRAVQKDGPKPFVVVVRDDAGRLAGIAPFYRTVYRLVGLLPYRVLRLVADYPTGSECLDWILREDCEREAAAAVVGALDASRREWDFIWMPYVPEWTGGRDRIRDAAASRGFLFAERPVGFGYLELPGSMGALVATLNPRQRTSYRSLDRKVFKESGGTFVRCRGGEDIARFLDALFVLHGKRWEKEGESGTFLKKPNEARFYRTFAPEADRKQWLRLYGIEVGGTLQAVQIGYLYNGVYLSMQEGFDPGGIAGIGNALRFKVMEDLIGEGVGAYDFLGELSEHKRRWRVVERRGKHLMIASPKVRNRLLFANGVWPTGRYLRHAELDEFRGKEAP